MEFWDLWRARRVGRGVNKADFLPTMVTVGYDLSRNYIKNPFIPTVSENRIEEPTYSVYSDADEQYAGLG